MQFLYAFITYCVDFALCIIALFNDKIKKGVEGRKNTFHILKEYLQPKDKTIWLHCASLGEYEQGLPVFEALRKDYPKHIFILTFFSPSGYDIKKDSSIADVVTYLPLDTKKNATHFLDLTHPELVIFVKYEIWPIYLYTLKTRKIKTILISALFRKNQVLFKSYTKWLRNSLKAFSHIFVQEENSKKVLNTFGFNNVSIARDTRFDRVYNQFSSDNTLDFIEEFKNDNLCIVAGSTWPEGEKYFIKYINENLNANLKFIIAPHNIKDKQIFGLKNRINKNVTLYTEKEVSNLKEAHVFIVDTIGILSKIYSYADIAYVGGAFGRTGLHNTLEPAVFGIPIVIGSRFEKFPEASEMKRNGGLFSISTYSEFKNILDELIKNKTLREKSGKSNRTYIKKNKGAVTKIMRFVDSET